MALGKLEDQRKPRKHNTGQAPGGAQAGLVQMEGRHMAYRSRALTPPQ
jgi:hypothetical protein